MGYFMLYSSLITKVCLSEFLSDYIIPIGIRMLFENSTLYLGSLSYPEPVNTPLDEMCITEKSKKILSKSSIPWEHYFSQLFWYFYTVKNIYVYFLVK